MRPTLPPGPAAPPMVQVARWIARPTDFMNRTRRECGDVFTVRLAGVGRVVFGEDEDPARLERLATAMTDLAAAGQNKLAMIPWLRYDLGRYSPMGMFMAVRERVDRVLFEEIQRRRDQGGLDARPDVLSML